MALRLRTSDGLYKVSLETIYYSTPVPSPCGEFSQKVSTFSDGNIRVMGTTKIVYDDYPSSWDTRVPSFRNFEVRSGQGGYTDTNVRISSSSWQCPNKRVLYEQRGPLALIAGGGWTYDVNTATRTDAVLADRALQNAWIKVSDPEIDFGENLATLGQTIKMIREPARALSKLLTLIAKGNRKTRRKKRKALSAKQALAEVEGRWLQYRYGVVPLMLDIEAGIDMYSSTMAADPSVKVTKGRALGPSTSNTTKYEAASLHPYVKLKLGTTTSQSYSVTACLYHQNYFGDYGIRAGLRRLGLNPSQLPRLAWNLLPLSFVVDWVWDVSSFLSVLDPVADKIYYGNSVQFKSTQEITRHFYGAYSLYPGTWSVTGSPCTATGITCKYKRVCFWPHPDRLLRGLDLNSYKRQLDAIALGLQHSARLIKR